MWIATLYCRSSSSDGVDWFSINTRCTMVDGDWCISILAVHLFIVIGRFSILIVQTLFAHPQLGLS